MREEYKPSIGLDRVSNIGGGPQAGLSLLNGLSQQRFLDRRLTGIHTADLFRVYVHSNDLETTCRQRSSNASTQFTQSKNSDTIERFHVCAKQYPTPFGKSMMLEFLHHSLEKIDDATALGIPIVILEQPVADGHSAALEFGTVHRCDFAQFLLQRFFEIF